MVSYTIGVAAALPYGLSIEVICPRRPSAFSNACSWLLFILLSQQGNPLHYFLFIYFELEENCFTVLSWFLPYTWRFHCRTVELIVRECLWYLRTWVQLMEEDMATHPSFLPGESHGQRSLAGYSPWCQKELDMTKASYHAQMETHIPLSRFLIFAFWYLLSILYL